MCAYIIRDTRVWKRFKGKYVFYGGYILYRFYNFYALLQLSL